MSALSDQDKIRMAQEYFTQPDQGRPDVLDLFHESANYLVVEGTSRGRMAGKSWEGGTPGGRFCNVFKFRDSCIANASRRVALPGRGRVAWTWD